ncbi:hypothetical protein BDK51DRAFT_45069 [Blyttiomyces helicus]|uniref:Uncharacterized protein n=1 Tax=Blyttiomyces helicus TaxID=388810 RepID=A0A4P9WJ31_9FUNG|nr:hypothetical protein BDK51DRAFT_45069 [Blyttiomyces helicus]|eukprot:RKO92055.1 hypothetical protein BDK51DRAFT_45069 [Blyttiomyces helicus]
MHSLAASSSAASATRQSRESPCAPRTTHQRPITPSNLAITSEIFLALTAHTPRLHKLYFPNAKNIAEVDFINYLTSKNSLSPTNSQPRMPSSSPSPPRLVSIVFGGQPAFDPSRFEKRLNDAIERPGSALEFVNVTGGGLERLVSDAGLWWTEWDGFKDPRLKVNEIAGIFWDGLMRKTEPWRARVYKGDELARRWIRGQLEEGAAGLIASVGSRESGPGYSLLLAPAQIHLSVVSSSTPDPACACCMAGLVRQRRKS